MSLGCDELVGEHESSEGEYKKESGLERQNKRIVKEVLMGPKSWRRWLTPLTTILWVMQ